MAGIFANIDSDISKIRQLKSEIEKVKKALTSINVKVDIDIAKGMEAQLKSLTAQYDALVQKVAQAEAKIAESTSRINKSAETIIKAQEQMTKAASGQGVANAQGASGGNTAATNAQTASVEAQAKAYDELADEIDAVMGTRSQNIKRMLEEQNAIRIINEEIKNLTKYQSGSSTLSASQQKRLEQLNASLLTHKTALSELRQSLNNSFKLDAAAATSMNALSQSLARMRMTYRELTEEERNSTFGKELLASIQQADAKIKQLDATIGNHQRNVGNYASGWNGLGMSIQQIGRELPSLAMGWNTFFLAISNNLPILTDEIKRAKDEYNRLKEAGQQATPVWKQVVSSLLSWQTALTVGITLLTLYGKDIIEWVGNLFKAKDGTKELEEAMKRLNTAISSVYGNASEEMRVLKDLNKSLENAKRGTEEWNQIRNKLVTGYSKYLPSIDQEIDKTGTLANSYDRLAESIQKAAAARGFEELKSNEDKKYADSLIKTYQDVSKRLVSLYGEEQGRAYFEGWKRWLERLNNGEELSAKVQGAYGNVSMSSWNPFNDDTLNSLMQDLNKQYKAREKALDEYRKIFGITEGAEDNIASDSIKALRDRIAANREALEKLSVSSKEYKDLLASIHKDEQRLSLLTSSQNAVQSEIKSSKSYLDELAKLREENEDREIDLMKEGTEKQLAEINLRYDREIEAVKKLRAELEQAQGGKLTTEQVSTFDAAVAGIEAGRKRDTGNAWNEKINRQEQAWNRYLQEYGTFQQKRQAITEEYNRKMAEATTAGEASMLQKQMEEALKEIDFNEFKGSINFADVFGNLDAQTTDALKSLREKLGEYINQAAKELRPEDLKELQDAFNQIDFKMAERDPFGELKQSVGEYKEAAREVEQAQKDLDTVMQGGEVITGLYTDEMGKLTKRTLSQEEAEKRLTDAQKKRQESLSKLTASANSIGRVGTQVVNAGNEIVDMLGAFGVSVSEEVAGALDGLGQVMSGLESIDLTKPFSALTGSVTILTGMGKTIASIFGLGGADYSGYEAMKNQYENLINVWDTLIGKKMEYIDIDYGMEAQKAADEAARLVETQINRQRQLIKQLASSGSGVGSHSLGVRIYDRLNAQDWERISELVGEKIDHEYQIWDLSAEQIEKILTDEKLVSVLDTVNSEFVTYLQNIVDYGNQLDEIAEKEKEAITGIGFESFRDSYVDLLTDLDSTNEDFADSFEKYLQESILSSLVANQYKSRIQDLYDSWAELGEDGLTPDEAEKLRQEYQQIANDLLAERDKLMNDFGWDTGTSSQQSATARGFETMTQDQASELNGRFTALYESSLRQEAIQQGISNIAEDARNIIAQSYLELQQISENTGAIIIPIQKIQKDIEQVKQNTSRL